MPDNKRTGFALKVIVVFAALTVFAALATAQCVDDDNEKTGIRFSNQSAYDLTFFVDEENTGVFVPSKEISTVREVNPGDHLLRARAEIVGMFVWIWDINEVPIGQICTWTVEDPT